MSDTADPVGATVPPVAPVVGEGAVTMEIRSGAAIQKWRSIVHRLIQQSRWPAPTNDTCVVCMEPLSADRDENFLAISNQGHCVGIHAFEMAKSIIKTNSFKHPLLNEDLNDVDIARLDSQLARHINRTVAAAAASKKVMNDEIEMEVVEEKKELEQKEKGDDDDDDDDQTFDIGGPHLLIRRYDPTWRDYMIRTSNLEIRHDEFTDILQQWHDILLDFCGNRNSQTHSLRGLYKKFSHSVSNLQQYYREVDSTFGADSVRRLADKIHPFGGEEGDPRSHILWCFYRNLEEDWRENGKSIEIPVPKMVQRWGERIDMVQLRKWHAETERLRKQYEERLARRQHLLNVMNLQPQQPPPPPEEEDEDDDDEEEEEDDEDDDGDYDFVNSDGSINYSSANAIVAAFNNDIQQPLHQQLPPPQPPPTLSDQQLQLLQMSPQLMGFNFGNGNMLHISSSSGNSGVGVGGGFNSNNIREEERQLLNLLFNNNQNASYHNFSLNGENYQLPASLVNVVGSIAAAAPPASAMHDDDESTFMFEEEAVVAAASDNSSYDESSSDDSNSSSSESD